jgi:hypothetical protein
MKTAVHLTGAFEPLYLNEPFDATMKNMSAASNANLIFFLGKDMDDQNVVIAIRNVLFMREEEDD